MDNSLSWKNHIDLHMKKLSMACYIIINTKIYMSASSLKMIYLAFFHSTMIYGIIFWGNDCVVPQILEHTQKKRKIIRIMEGCGKRVLCRNLFKKLQILSFDITISIIFLSVCIQNSEKNNQSKIWIQAGMPLVDSYLRT
jgi:hypothetical protein